MHRCDIFERTDPNRIPHLFIFALVDFFWFYIIIEKNNFCILKVPFLAKKYKALIRTEALFKSISSIQFN